MVFALPHADSIKAFGRAGKFHDPSFVSDMILV